MRRYTLPLEQNPSWVTALSKLANMKAHVLIIGGGSIGERHLRNFLRHEDVSCSLAEPDDGRRKVLQEQYEVRRAHADWEAVDLSEMDGVVICTPTNLHVPMLDQLAAAGVGILCEKPLAITSEGVDELAARLKRHGTLVDVAFCYRHHPIMEELKQQIKAGDLGAVSTALGLITQYWPKMRTQWPPQYALRRETGGGVIADHMVHWINLLEWLLGAVTSVAAFQRHMKLPDIATEDFGTVTMRFGEDRVGVLTTCMFQHNRQATLQIVGDDASAVFDLDKDHLQIYRASTQTWEQGKGTKADADDMLYYQAGHFLACLRGEATPRCSFDEASRTLDTVLAAIVSSDNNGQFVEIARTAGSHRKTGSSKHVG